MDLPMMLDLIAGPAGAFVFLLVTVYALLKGQLVAPIRELKASEEREDKLEKENLALSDQLTALAEERGELRVAQVRLTAQVEALKDEVARLRRRLGDDG